MALSLSGMASACLAPTAVTKPGVDFSRIRNLVVLEQEREDQRIVTDEFARQLMHRGYSVKIARADDPQAKADAWLQVSVAQFKPDRKFLVQLNKDDKGNPRDVLVVNPVTEISGSGVYPAKAFGLEDAQVLVSNSTVSLSARLLDGVTREVIWSDAVTYEGLDLDAAVQGSVASMLKHFPAP